MYINQKATRVLKFLRGDWIKKILLGKKS